jgi:hypothetical protein
LFASLKFIYRIHAFCEKEEYEFVYEGFQENEYVDEEFQQEDDEKPSQGLVD